MGRPIAYGGQAVIEGVMMRGPRSMAVAVRRPDQEIAIHSESLGLLARRYRLGKVPVLRGLFTLVESVKVGLDALMYSANVALGEDEEKFSRKEMSLTMLLSFLVGIGLFVVFPTFAVNWLKHAVPSSLGLNLIEGTLRVVILVGYLIVIARSREIQRVLEYHGAEHKTIAAYEAGRPLTVADVRPQSRFHPRCGTSYLLFVAIVAVFLFAFFGWPVLWERILLRLVLFPIVAGLAYELLRASAGWSGPWGKWIAAPGLWMQRLTTREPDDTQLEVAIRALEVVLE